VKAAENRWASRGYPRIGWRTLDARIKKKLPALRHILDGAVPSYYREDLECSVATRVNPKFRGMDNATACYYGPRGQSMM
jgi:hypothetical protein